jgi:FdhD protein
MQTATTDPDWTPSAALLPPAGRRAVAAWRVEDGGMDRRREAIAEETPVALLYNGQPFAVMMASPTDLADFARGFSLAEGIVGAVSDISAIETVTAERGIEIRLTIDAGYANALAARRRHLAGRSGCGLCGVDSFAAALRPLEKVTSPLSVPGVAIRRASAALPLLQALNREVGALHAAAFASCAGDILAVREDIGRHNALDKLIGAIVAEGIDPAAGFVLVTSRCSYEMVHKTASAGIALIAAVSAPTSMAVDLAARLGVSLIAFAREGRFTIYAGPERISEGARTST